jgi:hypothetical protein
MEKKYEDMTKREKAVAIAKDALNQLDKLQVVHGLYLESEPNNWAESGSAQCKIDEISNGCKVCAKGAMFLSKIRLGNDWDFKDFKHNFKHDPFFNPFFNGVRLYTTDTAITTHLEDAFDKKELDEIEEAFECSHMLRHLRGAARLRVILEHIVNNNGRFDENKFYTDVRFNCGGSEK